mgnify:CR=1 FL=1
MALLLFNLLSTGPRDNPKATRQYQVVSMIPTVQTIIKFCWTFAFASTNWLNKAIKNRAILGFKNAIKNIPSYDTPVFIADNTNNENNVAKKLTTNKWDEIIEEAEDAFDSLNIAQSKNNEGDTTEEWKRIFGPTFNYK